jgi:hypothetical protein
LGDAIPETRVRTGAAVMLVTEMRYETEKMRCSEYWKGVVETYLSNDVLKEDFGNFPSSQSAET